jgi:hypothetical protein
MKSRPFRGESFKAGIKGKTFVCSRIILSTKARASPLISEVHLKFMLEHELLWPEGWRNLFS